MNAGRINVSPFEALTNWSVDQARETYAVSRWGGDYFDISKSGELLVLTAGDNHSSSINLFELVDGLRERGLQTPLLLRFSDLLERRLDTIHDSFQRAFDKLGYKGTYQSVYPMKVNHQQQVVEDLMTFGRKHHYGLEAGSKAELLAAMAYLDDPDALLVCHGHKDESFVRLALQSLQMGLQTILIVEMPSELELILKESALLGIQPKIGIRIRLSTEVDSHWSHSSGDHSVFGLGIPELIEVVDRLKAENLLHCLQMFHFHAGSQISNILEIREATLEAVRIYVQLVKEGSPLQYFNLGGGLAVDYDGTQTKSPNSSNYSLDEYAEDVVEIILSEVTKADLSHPTLVTEAGRATVAHHSILVFNILEARQIGQPVSPGQRPQPMPEMMQNLVDVGLRIDEEHIQECYNDAIYYRDEMRRRFDYGLLNLRERAYGEKLFSHTMYRIAEVARGLEHIPEDLEHVFAYNTDIYHANVSIFQSLPDVWAIDQLFPIMPIHRLNEVPTRRGYLSDITCDCDGRIDRFADAYQVQSTLCLHELTEEPYYLGVFLVGAYQETLGDLHNLLGDTHVVSVHLNEDGELELSREVTGDTVEEVLTYVEYQPADIMERIRNNAERAVRAGRIKPNQRRDLLSSCRELLGGYTYCER